MSAVVTFDRMDKSYGDVQAVRDVSFEIPEGEVFGLLGPNGAGKTTLIRMLMDIIRPDSGTISVFGKPLDREALDKIGYLPEERGLYKKQKVLDVLGYFGELKGLSHGEARRCGKEWLERMSLAETAAWQVERLSKGMGQKVQIAAALLADPEVAILDEPFSGLDPVNVRLVQEMIKERGSKGRTTILSTHQMNMVEALCQRVALIHAGQLMVYGELEEVRERFSQPEVRITANNGSLPDLPGVQEKIHEENHTWRLRLQEGARPAAILAALVHAGSEVERFERVLAPMEEVFIRVVEGGRQ